MFTSRVYGKLHEKLDQQGKIIYDSKNTPNMLKAISNYGEKCSTLQCVGAEEIAKDSFCELFSLQMLSYVNHSSDYVLAGRFFQLNTTIIKMH